MLPKTVPDPYSGGWKSSAVADTDVKSMDRNQDDAI